MTYSDEMTSVRQGHRDPGRKGALPGPESLDEQPEAGTARAQVHSDAPVQLDDPPRAGSTPTERTVRRDASLDVTPPAAPDHEALPPATGEDGGVAAGSSSGSGAVGPSATSDARARASEPDAGTNEPLLAPDVGVGFRRDWEEIQGLFVDEPRRAVEEADRLVAGVMEHLAGEFAQERDRLEAQWGRGDDISTDALPPSTTSIDPGRCGR